MPTFNDARIRKVNERKADPNGAYVLYWMQAVRRLERNHALDYALHWARQLKKPLVVYEGLRLDYPWASARLHQFMLDGMAANLSQAKALGLNYWPYVETPEQPARGLLSRLAKSACLVVTDDYPAFIVPAQTAALGRQTEAALVAVDGNTIVPLELYGDAVSACAHLRHRVHRLFAEAWSHRAAAAPDVPRQVRAAIEPPFAAWSPDTFDLAKLPIDGQVQPPAGAVGGSVAGGRTLSKFLKEKLDRYGVDRNLPDDPEASAASGLSAYLRHGHISIQEVVEKVLEVTGPWTPDRLNPAGRGKREGYFHPDPNVNSFLDEAICWRDVGYHWHYCRNVRQDRWRRPIEKPPGWRRPAFHDLTSTLPAWALKTLDQHRPDARRPVYDLEVLESAETHDPLWNAAQSELVLTGRMHNYLRMLWGKKVLEWSATPELAYFTLEHLNNKYALDGRDPNSYTGILWCFGLFDRPWAPERKIFGTLRYMSSDNTAKKFKLQKYYDYIEGLKGRA